MARVLLLQHWRKRARNRENKGFGGAKHTQKVMPRTTVPLFGWQQSFTSPLSNPPLCTSHIALCPALWRWTLGLDNNHSKQGRQRTKGGGQKFVFPSNQPFFRSFSLQQTQGYTTLFCFFLMVFFQENFIWRNLFLIHRHFPFLFGLFFLPFCFFSDSVIYFFFYLHLCIFFTSSFGNVVSSSI